MGENRENTLIATTGIQAKTIENKSEETVQMKVGITRAIVEERTTMEEKKAVPEAPKEIEPTKSMKTQDKTSQEAQEKSPDDSRNASKKVENIGEKKVDQPEMVMHVPNEEPSVAIDSEKPSKAGEGKELRKPMIGDGIVHPDPKLVKGLIEEEKKKEDNKPPLAVKTDAVCSDPETKSENGSPHFPDDQAPAQTRPMPGQGNDVSNVKQEEINKQKERPEIDTSELQTARRCWIYCCN